MTPLTDKAPKFTRDLPEARRKQLIEATARSLARHGMEGTTVRVVAAEAGVSPGLVRHHFAGMHDLIAETYRWTGKEVDRALRASLAAAEQTPEAQLRAFVDSSFSEPMLDTDLLGVWLTFWSLTRTDPEIHAIHGKVYAGYRRRLEELIRELAVERKLKVDARVASLAFTALLDGLWLEHCLDASTFTAREAAMIAHDWVDNLIAGRFLAGAKQALSA
ncbi:TetR family transcriptional regulator [Dongia mobilis]|uniref:TetR family transcriptional regulator n=1 Tax=Dongia mobilis TaxID=578943 RepID=A0A4R6WT82_9PROT|nr:TetR family transcriptional regulator [Dongia mobilis]